MEFNIGDHVVCVGTSRGGNEDDTFGGVGWELGKEFIVKKITNPNSNSPRKSKIYWSGWGYGGVWGSHLELFKELSPEHSFSLAINKIVEEMRGKNA